MARFLAGILAVVGTCLCVADADGAIRFVDSPSPTALTEQNQDLKILKERIELLEAKLELLKKENDLLKRENDSLKRELSGQGTTRKPPAGDDKPSNPKATFRGIEYEISKCTRNGSTVKLTFLLLSPKSDANAVFGGLSAIDSEGTIHKTTMRSQIQPGGGIGGVRLSVGVKSKIEVTLNVPTDVTEFRQVEVLAGSGVLLPKGESIRFKNVKITE